MERGRLYRQILPQAFTPDAITQGAPVRCTLNLFMAINNGFFEPTSDPSAVAEVDLLNAKAIWRGTIFAGSTKFFWTAQQTWENHVEGFRVIVDGTDHFTATFRIELQWLLGRNKWNDPAAAFYGPGYVVSVDFSEVIQNIYGCYLGPVKYHDEP